MFVVSRYFAAITLANYRKVTFDLVLVSHFSSDELHCPSQLVRDRSDSGRMDKAVGLDRARP
jgi:hypothetical protein